MIKLLIIFVVLLVAWQLFRMSSREATLEEARTIGLQKARSHIHSPILLEDYAEAGTDKLNRGLGLTLHKSTSSTINPFMRSHFEPTIWDLPVLNSHFSSKNKLTCQYPGDYCKPIKSSTGNSQTINTKSGSKCPTGFYSSGSYCKRMASSDREAIPREEGGKCPTGWYKSGGYCVR